MLFFHCVINVVNGGLFLSSPPQLDRTLDFPPELGPAGRSRQGNVVCILGNKSTLLKVFLSFEITVSTRDGKRRAGSPSVVSSAKTMCFGDTRLCFRFCVVLCAITPAARKVSSSASERGLSSSELSSV